MRLFKFLFVVFCLILCSQILYSQGYEDMLVKEVEVENPVYMPVLGLGTGFMNYYGEMKNDTKNMLQGRSPFRLNLYQPIGKNHNWRVNINVLVLGKMAGYETAFPDTSLNLNFKSDITASIGANFEYNFGHLFKGDRKIKPFLSVGAEYFNYSTSTDLRNEAGNYNYFPDGTIRVNGEIVHRDYDYEENIQTIDRFDRGEYTPSNYAVVGDVGLDFKISNRVVLRLATSLHYTFTDDLDGISYKNESRRIGDTKNDMFSLTYVNLNIDLFSDPKTRLMESLFMDISGDFDYTIIADSDHDGVLDLKDDCYNTPEGVAVDSVGCPFDDDKDGIPNYIDSDLSSVKGAIVDASGIELTPEQILATLLQNIQAVERTDVYMIPIGLGWSKYSQMSNVEIPQKFKKLDINNDEYISFDELLKAISNFFDSDEEFKPEDIYELNNFFFAQ